MTQESRERSTSNSFFYEESKFDTAKRKRLEWFFDFLQLDLNNCTMNQLNLISIQWLNEIKAKYTKELYIPTGMDLTDEPWKNFVTGALLVAKAAEIIAKITEINEDGDVVFKIPIREMQRELKKKTEPLFNRIDSIQKKECYNFHFDYLAHISEQLETSNDKIEEDTPPFYEPVILTEDREAVIQVLIHDGEPARIQTAISLPDDISAISYIFFQEIDGVPIDSFKRCAECNEWFLQLSKKDKKFCSTPCINKNRQRANRKEKKINDPEGYKKDKERSRQRARKSYENKIESKLGKGVKPAKRPRTKKEE